ncbi:hypothetical protein CWI60_05270, partial [Neisseria meningitidis]|uniref:hypothetical protein n=1 Tax=Neisseria meningitidis TaxID=487 RepID=UPI000CC1A67E
LYPEKIVQAVGEGGWWGLFFGFCRLAGGIFRVVLGFWDNKKKFYDFFFLKTGLERVGFGGWGEKRKPAARGPVSFTNLTPPKKRR